MYKITDYEKIATVYQCHMAGISKGRLGEARAAHNTLHPDRSSVCIEIFNGPAVLVCMRDNLWHVTFKDFVGASHNLEEAARFALESGRFRRNLSREFFTSTHE